MRASSRRFRLSTGRSRKKLQFIRSPHAQDEIQAGRTAFAATPHEAGNATRRPSRRLTRLDGDFDPAPENDLQWPPFRSFGENYCTYQILIDFKVGDGMAVRTEPHRRYYTDPNDEVPLAVPALLRTSWWPMISFIMIFRFRAPVFTG